MPRKKKKTEEVVTTEIEENIVENPTETKENSSLEAACLKLQKLLEGEPLKVSVHGPPLNMIRIFSENQVHCLGRVKQEGDYLHGQLLSNIPAAAKESISKAFADAGIINRNQVYLSPTGYP